MLIKKKLVLVIHNSTSITFKGKDAKIRELLIEGKPEYILCHGVEVAPSVDNIKTALGDTSPWDEKGEKVKVSEYDKQLARIAEVKKKLEDAIAERAEKALAVIQTAEQKQEQYQKLVDEAKDKITKAKKVVSEVRSSVPKVTEKRATTPKAEPVDIDALAKETEALASV